jgi:hypothetical protein
MIIAPIVVALVVLAVFAARDALRATGGHRIGAIFGTGLILATAIALTLLVALGNLTVTVTSQQLTVRYFLLLAAIRRRIPIDEIVMVRAETYEPMREFLGWGVKWSQRDSTTAYSVSGNRGVRIQLRSGEKLLIGTNRADALAAAIEEGRASVQGSSA